MRTETVGGHVLNPTLRQPDRRVVLRHHAHGVQGCNVLVAGNSAESQGSSR